MAQLQNLADKSQFLDVMSEFIKYGNTKSMAIQECCNEDIKTNLFNITQTIKSLNKGDITYNDICISVFALYYKMNLVDYSSPEDILKKLIKKPFADNPKHVNDLILKIGVEDLIINGENLSQAIRRYMLFGDSKHQIGGRSKAHRSKAHRSKAHRSKPHRSKTHRSKARKRKATRKKN